MISVANFRIKFPEFASTTDYSDAVINEKIDEAHLFINTDCWGNKAELGGAYLAAHLTWLYANKETFVNGDYKGIRTKKVGDIMVEYDEVQASEYPTGELYRTNYGLAYMRIRRTLPSCGFFVVRNS